MSEIAVTLNSNSLIGSGSALFLVSGRVHGDDDDTAYLVLANDDAEAADTFREHLILVNYLESDTSAPTIYVITNEQVGDVMGRGESARSGSQAAQAEDEPEQDPLDLARNEAFAAPRKEGENVALLYAGSDIIITLKGEYYGGSFAGTDLEVGRGEMWRQADALSRAMGLPLVECHVPVEDIRDRETEHVIARAKAMGVFTYDKTVFDLIDEEDVSAFIDGRHMPYALNSGWIEQVETEGPDACIWTSDNQDECSERFYSFTDLCQAKRQPDGSWLVPETGGRQTVVTFKR